MRKQLSYLILITGLVFTGCQRDFSVNSDGDSGPGRDGSVGIVQQGVPFEIGVGRAVFLDNAELTIEFSLVTEDSRCASNVDCVHPGRAGVLLTLTDHQNVKHQIITHIPGLVSTPYRFNDIIQFQNQRFRLLRLNPYPKAGSATDFEDYLALIEVEAL